MSNAPSTDAKPQEPESQIGLQEVLGSKRNTSHQVKVWDLPTRLFHWLLVATLGVSVYTGLTGGFTEMDIHMTSGGIALALISFRVLWGFLGGHYSRFSSFYPTPKALRAYFKANRPAPGHSPLAGLSIFALLTCIVVQAGTGLFANDDIFTEGPLAHWVTYETSRQLTAIHETNLWVLASLVGLHLGAIAVYELKKGRRLILAMITGKEWHEQPGLSVKDSWQKRLLAIALLAITSACVYAFIYN